MLKDCSLGFSLFPISFCRFKSDEDRAPIYRVIEETFPHLLNIFNKLVHVENPSLEVADHIKLICKIFWSCIYVSCTSYVNDSESFFNAPWLQME